MTTELVLLLFLFLFIVAGAFLNNNTGLEATFKNAGPNLGARVEKHIETGTGFLNKDRSWGPPP